MKAVGSNSTSGPYQLYKLEDLPETVDFISGSGWYTFCIFDNPESIGNENRSLVLFNSKHFQIKPATKFTGVFIAVNQEQFPQAIRDAFRHYPLFYQDGNGPFKLDSKQHCAVSSLFGKIADAINSSYVFKEQLIAGLAL